MPTHDELQALALSLKVAAAGLAASLPPAIAIAFVLARKDFRGKTLFDAIVHLPLVLPPVVVGYALLILMVNRQRGSGTRALFEYLVSTEGLDRGRMS